ncbi:hypothetical protein T01_2841 [Trichinella spiralis]|uniref:Uncharacterized protein n=1 Tax=Trichinella spiralis TaxID=6334 RepID=A0A0V1AX43_TRISP|nr:hypothetical protein T01_2841 [Trichinella spiralis]
MVVVCPMYMKAGHTDGSTPLNSRNIGGGPNLVELHLHSCAHRTTFTETINHEESFYIPNEENCKIVNSCQLRVQHARKWKIFGILIHHSKGKYKSFQHLQKFRRNASIGLIELRLCEKKNLDPYYFPHSFEPKRCLSCL